MLPTHNPTRDKDHEWHTYATSYANLWGILLAFKQLFSIDTIGGYNSD